MDEPERAQSPFDMPMGDVFADVPLFREIQRVLLSSSGPVNWELARQVGIAAASWGVEDRQPTDEDRTHLEDTVRVAELRVAEFTGLAPPADLPHVEAVRRGQWVQANIEGLKALVEPAASRVADALAKSQPAEPRGEAAEAGPFGPGGSAMLAQLSPLLLGAQVGTVLGYLGQHVLGQYDIAVPRPAPGALLFVIPNIAAFERDWSLDPVEFRAWVALHEVTHRFEFARPWARDRFRELLEDFLSTIEFDLAGLQERIERIDVASPEALQSLFESEEGLFGTILDAEQRIKLGRIQAFMAAAEGYGDHVMHAIGRQMLGSYERIDEAKSRIDMSEGDPVFERLLGVEMKKEQYVAGRRFCDTVVELADEATLSRMWESAESMPSLPEVHEPRLWLARTV